MREKKMSDELNFTPPSSPDTLTSLSISKALERLDRNGRELITLRFIDGLSYAEMGSILDTGEAALRGKIYRVLRKLRKIMEESSDDL